MKFQILALVVAMALLLSCSSQQPKNEKVEVLFWHAMGGPLGEALTLLVDEFNATNDSIFVSSVNMGNYSALSTKVMASIQTRETPDVAQAFESWTANLIDGNVIVPVQDFIDADPAYRDSLYKDMFPVMIKGNIFGGKLWSFAFNKSVRVLYYNKDLLFINNLDPNKPPVTWAEFLDYCRKLTVDKDGDGTPEVYGTTFPVSAWQFENLLLQAGGEIMAEDNKTPLFNGKPGIEALEFLKTQLDENLAYLSTGYDGQNDFLAGKLAMIEGSSVSMAYMKKQKIDFFMGISGIPVYKTKRNIISGTNVVIFKKKDPRIEKAAWEFVKWFTDSSQTARWSEMTYYMPVRRSAFNEPGLKKRLNCNPEIRTVYEQLEYSTFEPPISEWYAARKYLEEHVIEKVLRNKLSAKEALDKAAGKIARDLK
ncbi:MAG: ABC transporter substrate-binding protein [Candidatus Cloacimonetes bacterium]|nr:ABC transporter substrate-binding protein [Candidatus Cloacimonadota bacterium]